MTSDKRLMQGIVDTKVSKNVVLKGSCDVIRYVSGIVRSGWNIRRDGYSDVLSGGFDIPLFYRDGLPNRFNTFSRVYRSVVPNRLKIEKGHLFCLVNQYDSEREVLSGLWFNRFSLSEPFQDTTKAIHDRIRFPTGSGLWSGLFDLVPMRPDCLGNRYASITEFPHSKITGRFSSSLGNIRSKNLCRWDSLRYWTKDRLSGTYVSSRPFQDRLRCRPDAIFSRSEIPGLTALLVSGRYDINRLRLLLYGSRFDCIIALQPQVRRHFLYDSRDRTFEFTLDTRRCDRQSFVRPGWRILATNITTGESFDLGFVDTETPTLKDVSLPDGDYEIFVLSSSLFWKDCLDRTVRTISVRPGEEVTPLPTIYNLRSAVLDGVTTIRWSANRSDDCVFGVWYDSQSPVNVARPPDTTVWYYASQTEYVTTFYQNAPAYVAVTAIRTGNEPETGKVHELYLDWSSVPPRRPDDVMVLNVPLPAIDSAIEQRHEDDPFWTMWDG
jgi:hypothetical protein